jgi:uncharacterized protein (DUF1697 family)
VPVYIAFLRAINVGGHHTVKMEDLRAHFEALGFARVETFIASGNVIFASNARDTAAMATRIQVHLHKALGHEVTTFIRTDAEFAAIARYRPFASALLASAKALNVAFLANPLPAATRKTVMQFTTDIDQFHVHGREVYWLCRKSGSKFSNARFEKTLGIQATFRGFNTIQRLADKFPPSRQSG